MIIIIIIVIQLQNIVVFITTTLIIYCCYHILMYYYLKKDSLLLHNNCIVKYKYKACISDEFHLKGKYVDYDQTQINQNTVEILCWGIFSMLSRMLLNIGIYIYIYPKWLTVHSGYTFFSQYMCSLGIEPTTFALLTQCSTTEPQEQWLEHF